MLQVKKKKITLKLGNGTYINTGTIKLPKTNAVLTIEGNGQTIDANKQQAFYIENFGSMILKNITITNGESNHGGAIENRGTLTITQSTLNNNNAYNGGAIINFKTLTINQTTLNNNTAYYGGAVRNKEGTMLIRESTLNNNTAKEFGGAIENSRYHLFSILNSNFTKIMQKLEVLYKPLDILILLEINLRKILPMTRIQII